VEFSHLPVMAREVAGYIGCRPGGVYVDGTVGGGGYARELLRGCAEPGDVRLIGMDVDAAALKAAALRLADFTESITLVRRNFREIRDVLDELGIESIDGLMLDLGVSSHQIDDPERGFSFRFDARLDMRMDRRLRLSASEIVNRWDAARLEEIFRDYGEERRARRIAVAIVEARKRGPIETTRELADIIIGALPPHARSSRTIHPATRVFQALRIAVNDELESLRTGLAEGAAALRPGARLVAVSFHSLEDRIVKETFRSLAASCVCPPGLPVCVCEARPVLRVLTRRVLRPAPEEVAENPRARSAKLRAAERI